MTSVEAPVEGVKEPRPQAVLPEAGVLEKSRGPWSDAWRRLVRNKASIVGLLVIIAFVLIAIFAPQLTEYSYAKQNYLAINSAPQWIIDLFPKMAAMDEPMGYVRVNNDYWLGTDGLGRDLFTRIIYGARISLSVAFIGPLTSLLVGTIYGMVSGYAGGRTDNIMMRIVDVMYAFPSLLLIILMMAFFRSSFSQSQSGTLAYQLNKIDSAFGGMLFIFIGIGITSWMDTARLARGQVLSLREKEFIEAAHSIGVSDRGIIFRHVLPNIMGPVIVRESLAIPRYISTEAFLSFIGLGVNPPTPSWGNMISEGAQAIKSYPNQAIFPALALFFLMFAFNFLGDGLRDALDPRATKEA
ncbi:MAG TPA: ABC transporter permease [Aggregatilineaceae bacterium]|jgi:oligopeptide transport system permease protein|nr:ABC transporter permease [Anaerolineae bacterium]HMM27977.1 ABC transporter permease [Aggregatilineaceae bacterium]